MGILDETEYVDRKRIETWHDANVGEVLLFEQDGKYCVLWRGTDFGLGTYTWKTTSLKQARKDFIKMIKGVRKFMDKHANVYA